MAAALLAPPAPAQDFRIATYSADLGRFGPGILYADLRSGRSEEVSAVVEVLVRLNADILLLTDIDYDAGGLALSALAARLAARGLSYPHLLALRPNSGVSSGLDLDGDGTLGSPRDAIGFGRFAGAEAMALLSRYPIDAAGVRDFTALLWRDLPGHLMPPATPRVAEVQRLSSVGHWDVPVVLPGGRVLRVLAYSAGPPVFDGPEDRNGRRNHDEAALWLAYLDGKLPDPPPEGPLVLLGKSNLDPVDGEGRQGAIRALLTHPRLQDPAPRGTSVRTEPGHLGDPALDTALFDTGAGGLRTDILLPSRDLTLRGAGVLWPPDADPFAQVLATASRHRPVWADLSLPP